MSDSFDGHGLRIDGLVFLSPREALPFLEGEAILVDLREGREINGRMFNVKNLIALPYRELANQVAMLPRDRPLILADCVGLNSKEALRFLLEQGYEAVAVLNGGMIDWLGDRLPTVIDRDEELAGSCTCRLRPRKDYLATY